MPKNPANFNVDNVRVVKIPGGGAGDSRVLKGVVVKRGAEGNIKDVADAKVAVFAQGVDTSSTETKARQRSLLGCRSLTVAHPCRGHAADFACPDWDMICCCMCAAAIQESMCPDACNVLPWC